MSFSQSLRQPWPMPTLDERARQDAFYARLNQTPLPPEDCSLEIADAADHELVAQDAFDAAEDRWLTREDE